MYSNRRRHYDQWFQRRPFDKAILCLKGMPVSNKTFLILFFLLIFFSSAKTLYPAQESPQVIDRHKDLSLKCADCHGEDNPSGKPAMKACLECHGSYDEIAAKTEHFEQNPHKSHLGNLRCSYCHSSHGNSKLYCNECHDFKEFKMR